MALYSISVNAEEARVLQSEPGLGTSLTVATDTESLAEKADQSTFPRFEQEPSGSWAMRGPKNIVRTAAEFALEHRRRTSPCTSGTPGGGGATLYQLGLASLLPAVRASGATARGTPLVKRLALAAGPDDLADRCEARGCPLSERSARRILDGAIVALDPLTERLAAESFPRQAHRPSERRRNSKNARLPASGSRGHRYAEARHRPAHGARGGNVLSGSGGRGGGHRGPGSHPHHRSHPHVALRKRAVAPLGCNR